MYGADPRLADWGTKTGCRRLFAEEGVPSPAGRTRTCTPSTTSPTRCWRCGPRAGRRWAARSSSSTRASPARATRSSTWPACPAPGRPAERGRGRATRLRGDAAREPRRAARRVRREARRARRHRRGARDRRRGAQPQRAAPRPARAARSSCSRRTTSCSAARAGRATSAAKFPADFAYARAIIGRGRARSAPGWPTEGVLGRFAIDFVVVRGTPTGCGRRTRSRSTSARAARPIRSSPCSS